MYLLNSRLLCSAICPVGREHESRNERVEAEVGLLTMTHCGILCFLSLLLKGSTFLLESIARVPLNLHTVATAIIPRTGGGIIILVEVSDPDHRRRQDSSYIMG